MTTYSKRFLLHMLPLFITVMGVFTLARYLPLGATQQLPISKPVPNCQNPPLFSPGYKGDAGAIRYADNGAVLLMGESWLQTDVCQPGTLVIDTEGQVAGGAAPKLTVALDGQTLLERSVSERRTIHLRIQKPGHLTLAYLNDYYLSEARTVTLMDFRQLQSQCQLKINVPPETGGTYNAQVNTAILVFDVPMTLTPCRSGLLSFRVIGRSGGGKFPTLAVMQSGSLLKSIQSTAGWQRVEVNVSAQPLTIHLTNPYFKELGDRNLILHHIDVKNIGPE